MSVQKITFKNYKSFEQEQVFEIKPITIVIGKNNSGKSALIKLPLMLNEWLSGNNDLLLNYHKELSFAKNWKELFFNGVENKALEFTINMGHQSELEISVHLKLNEYKYLITYLEWKYFDESEWKAAWDGKDLKKPVYIVSQKGKEPYEYTQNGKKLFQGLRPTSRLTKVDYSSDDEYDLQDLLSEIGFFQYFTGIRHTFSDANMSFDALKKQDLDVKGEFAVHALYQSPNLLEKVRDWYINNMEGWGIDIEKNEENDGFYLFLKDFNKKAGTKVPITQTGQGITQVLPLVVATLDDNIDIFEINSTYGIFQHKTIIIEQPELHIHPAAHGSLVELFAESAIKNGHNYILETHSEVMLLRIRRLVAEGKLKPEQVAIYWIDTEEGSEGKRSFLKKIAIDEEGNLDGWPTGVFSEDYNELMHIRKARKK